MNAPDGLELLAGRCRHGRDPGECRECWRAGPGELGRPNGAERTTTAMVSEDFAQPAPAYPRTWRPEDLTAVLEGTYRPPTPTVGRREDGQPVLYPGKVHSLAAESEAGKTWLALALVREELDAGNHAVYLDFEDDVGSIVGRLLAMGTNYEAIRERFHYIRPGTPLGAGVNRDDLDTTLDTYRPTLVILDGITNAMTLHGLDLVANKDYAMFAAMLPTRIAATGAAVLALDHVTKSREGRGRHAIGAVHKLNGLDGAAFILEPVATIGIGLKGRSRVRIGKDRPGQLRAHALPALDAEGMAWFADMAVDAIDGPDMVVVTLDPPTSGASSPASARRRPTVYMHRVSDVLEGREDALSQRQILERVKGNKDETCAAIAALTDEGYIEVTPGPNRSKLHRLVKPFTEDQS